MEQCRAGDDLRVGGARVAAGGGDRLALGGRRVVALSDTPMVRQPPARKEQLNRQGAKIAKSIEN